MLRSKLAKMASNVLVIGFDRTAEIEMIISIDILRRADFNVTIANLDDKKHIEGDSKTLIKAETRFKDVLNDTFDAIVIPGGPDEKKHFPKLAEVSYLSNWIIMPEN